MIALLKAILDYNAMTEVEKYRRHLKQEEYKEEMRLIMDRGEIDIEENGADGEDSDSDEDEKQGTKKGTNTFKLRPKSQTWFLPMHRRNTIRYVVTLKGMRFCSKGDGDGDETLREVLIRKIIRSFLSFRPIF